MTERNPSIALGEFNASRTHERGASATPDTRPGARMNVTQRSCDGVVEPVAQTRRPQ